MPASSGPGSRPSASARNWSPRSTNAIPGAPPRSVSEPKKRLEERERLVERADLQRDVVDPEHGHLPKPTQPWPARDFVAQSHEVGTTGAGAV